MQKSRKQASILEEASLKLSLIVYGDVPEEVSHGLAVVDTADGLGQDHAHIHRFDLGTLQLLYFVWDGVCNHHLQQESVMMSTHHEVG